MSKTFTYKGYKGSIDCSIDDACLYGKVLFIEDVISYEGSTITELKKAFEESLDDYLATCKEVGKDPDKSFAGSFNIRIGPQTHKDAALVALEENQTLNEFIKEAVEEKIFRSNAININITDLMNEQYLFGEIEKEFSTSDDETDKVQWKQQTSPPTQH